MRLLSTAVLIGTTLLVFESDQMPDWSFFGLHSVTEAWQGLVRDSGLEGPKNGLRQSFWQWLDGEWTVQESQPAQPKETSLIPVFSSRQPLRILVLGDSLAGFYLPNALGQLARVDGRIEVESLYRVAASLSNPARMDFLVEVPRFWEQRLRQAGRGYDLVVILMGANDNQPIRHQGRWLRFNSASWQEEYSRRLRSLLDYVVERSHHVYWLELPPMREPGLERDVRVIEDLVRSVLVEYPKVRFLNQRQLLSYRGEYTAVGVLEGVQVQLRSRDGIHLSTNGARILAHDIWNWVFKDFVFEPKSDPATSTDSP